MYDHFQFAELKLNNPGILIGRLPNELFESLKICVQQAIDDNVSKAQDLVGMIKNLYAIKLNTDIISYLTSMTGNYQNKFGFKGSQKLKFTSSWVNVQKKYEYSPVHHHPQPLGWVIWVKIPYNLQDEINMPNSIHSKVKKNSNFEFVYSNLGGEIQTHSIPVDQSYEGIVMMFPGYLKHLVYPFYTSDDYRISVAGNIRFEDVHTQPKT